MGVSPEELNIEEDDNVIPIATDIMQVPEEMMRKEQSVLATHHFGYL